MSHLVRAAACFGLAVAVAGAEPVVIDGPLTVTLDSQQGYALSGLRHTARGLDLLAPAADRADPALWRLHWRGADGRLTEVRPQDAQRADHRREGATLLITWSGVGRAAGADLTVTARVTRRARGDVAWRLAVRGTAPGALWQVDYPRLAGLHALPADQLALPYYLGRLMNRPAQHRWSFRANYPQPMSMQFWAWWGAAREPGPALPQPATGAAETGWSPDGRDAAGLYWATEDGQGWFKRFGATFGQPADTFTAWVEHVPEIPRWPVAPGTQAIDYATPYDTVVAALDGDWHEAAARYGAWAHQQVWCRRGPAEQWPTATPAAGSEALAQWVPTWFRQVGFWAKFYHEPAKVVPEWAAYRRWLGVPLASHYYRYNIALFDDNYPEHLPGDPYLLAGLRDARDMEVRALPYVQGSIWDTDTPSWHRESGRTAAIKDEHGQLVPWDIDDRIFAWMCPATGQWQAKQREATAKLTGEHGCSGNYLDVLVATSARTCYDPAHGHPLHGGRYWGQGGRQLLHDLRAATRRRDPDAAFFSEEIGELYIDGLDGQLSLDQLRFGLARPNVQVWPLFAAVYHPYTINFGCDAALGQPVDLYCWSMAQMLVWGSVPLNSATVALTPQAGEPASEFLREVVRAYHVAGRPFLLGGQWQRLVVQPTGTAAGRAPIELACAPAALSYGTFGRKPDRTWHGPAVMASAWRRGQQLGLVLANHTGSPQPVELSLRPDELGLAGARLQRTWPDRATLGAAAGTHRLTLPARKVVVLVVGAGEAPPAEPLLDAPWELQTVVDGPFPPLTGPAGSLWSCADGPVQCQLTPTATVAKAHWLAATGTLAPRSGRQAARRGPAAEGRGLPRAAAEQPFLLLHRLPYRVAGGGDLVVWSGDGDHLCAHLRGGTRLVAPQPGVWVRSGAEPAFSTAPELAVPAGSEVVVAHMSAAALAAAGPAAAAFARAPSPATLAAAARAWAAQARAQREEPGAFLAHRPFMRAGRGLRGLVAAACGWQLQLQADDDWLSPATAKPLRLVAWRTPAAVAPAKLDLVPLGPWPSTITVPPDGAAGWPAFPVEAAFRVGAVTERTAPVLATAEVAAAGQTMPLWDVRLLEAERPIELRLPTRPVPVVAGRSLDVTVAVRNWSPQAGRVHLSAAAPTGWTARLEPGEVAAPALTDATVRLRVDVPAAAPRGRQDLRVLALWNGAAEAGVPGLLPITVVPAMEPVSAGSGPWTPPADANLATNRQEGSFQIWAVAGERLQIELRNVRVTIYTNSLTYQLKDADLRPLRSGTVKVDQAVTIDLPAPSTGVYTLEVAPGSGSAVVRIANRVAGEVAEASRPLRLFGSHIRRCFWVPAGARGFRLGYTDGGPDETARFRITSPTGRVALDYEGNGNGAEMPVEVRSGEDGRLWWLTIEPRQDMSCWLAGEVTPCLSSAPERALREVRQR